MWFLSGVLNLLLPGTSGDCEILIRVFLSLEVPLLDSECSRSRNLCHDPSAKSESLLEVRVEVRPFIIIKSVHVYVCGSGGLQH